MRLGRPVASLVLTTTVSRMNWTAASTGLHSPNAPLSIQKYIRRLHAVRASGRRGPDEACERGYGDENTP